MVIFVDYNKKYNLKVVQDNKKSNICTIKLEPGIYVITGGAIKLTRTMQEREHTLRELERMEQVRAFLLTNNIIDKDAFIDYMSELP